MSELNAEPSSNPKTHKAHNALLERFAWPILYLVVFMYILRYTFIYWVVLTIGFSSAIIGIAYVVLSFSVQRPVDNRRKLRRFKFVQPEEWKLQVLSLSTDKAKLDQHTTDSFLISETIDELVNLIIKCFIDGWFHHISSSTLFQDDIRIEFKSVVENLRQRLETVDYAKLVVSRLLPIIHEHFENFVKAEHAVYSRASLPKADSSEYHIAVAQAYDRGKIHSGVTIGEATNAKEKIYLREKVSSILPYVLSEAERNNEISLSLVTEILACTILTSIFQMVGEGDFYNLLIVKLIGDNLKHRGQVKQLRAALEEHTQQLTHKSSTRSFKPSDVNIAYSITEDTDTTTFRELALSSSKTVETSNKVVETLQLSDILNQPSACKLFGEYLSYRNKRYQLEFVQAIDQLKAPLEDATIDEDGETNLSLSLEFGTIEDIKNIYYNYLENNTFNVDYDYKGVIETLVFSKDEKSAMEVYKKCRKELFRLQKDIIQALNDAEFQSFKRSSLFSKLINFDTIQDDNGRHKKAKSKTDNNEVSLQVLQAVENAFTQIMQNPEANSEDFSFNKNKDPPIISSFLDYSDDKPVLTIDMKKSLFGDSSSLFGGDANDMGSNRHSRLFDDVSDDSMTDSDSMNLEGRDSPIEEPSTIEQASNSDSQVFLAAPGDLSLAEEISKLTEEIEKLHEQIIILDPLIKKAELTNNITELKILRKSRVSLDREINSKELQKQQYIVQENDNSLYGKSRVSIQSYISGNEHGKEFILYIVEVQKVSSDDANVVTAGWIVARRFSQFFKLHEYLRARYPQVANIKFPKRTMLVLKFQQRLLVDLRKTALEEYLQQLITIPEVCSNKAFRSFLSSENFNLRKNQAFEEGVSNSANYEMRPKNNIETVANKLYNGISNKLIQHTSSVTESTTNEEIMENIRDMQKELRQYDEAGASSSDNVNKVFVKPICDLLIAVFRLNNTKSWIRGRALIVILQQIFGTTIEKKVNEQINQQLRTEESILDILIMLKNTIFPHGRFKDPPMLRTIYQQAMTKQEAKVLLAVFMNETCSKIFGASNTSYASSNLFSMLQNDYLNKHLLFELLDEALAAVFPEIKR
ncbi:intermediate filament protein [Suhomyces tanzawaensis NRRL Y-17324]|uniref:Intermediate filament protein n=1 Tax=Suhomyces tanzawaensis NRRL Y-17324 TaxID=984487 RepID=A0A1E4SRU2_9ASCO|nr:intermediate filament protein [Suhomyces tanzawaensis NRRL Y-17324]ODV82215.1 intermediate filament protein [Suhomyces tanzawaensis NRRL Y-17324]